MRTIKVYDIEKIKDDLSPQYETKEEINKKLELYIKGIWKN